MDTSKNNPINHIGVIIDGNRRYAKAIGLPAWRGHYEGAKRVEDLLRWCKELEIKEVTVYALSTENLKREKEELRHLFGLFKNWFENLEKNQEIRKNKLKIRFIGDLSLVPEDIKKLAKKIEQDTKNNNNYIVNFCFAYGGRNELLEAFNKLKDKKGKITEEDVTNALWLSSEPDFIIRTGGKSRTSNFLPWQSIYSEWFFLNKMWPEIKKQDLIDCINRFYNTKRNFGK